MIAAYDYYTMVVKPTVHEFQADNRDLRLALLACTVTLHLVDYVMQNRAPNPDKGQRMVEEFNRNTQHFSFRVVKAFALASKHCRLVRGSMRGFHSGNYMVAFRSFFGEMRFGQSFFGDTVGGVTIRWTESQEGEQKEGHKYVNLTLALTETLKLYEAEFPEITR